MYIRQITIENYKSFWNQQEIQFTPGMNIVVAPNNAGKTALVEALSLHFEQKPHISLLTIPTRGSATLRTSVVHVTFTVPQQEFRELLWNNSRVFYIPRGETNPDVMTKNVLGAFSTSEINLRSKYHPGNLLSANILEVESQELKGLAIQFRLENIDTLPKPMAINYAASPEQYAAFVLAKILAQRVYYFRAERFNAGQYQIGNDPLLKSDASNLAQVLNLLQTSNLERFRRFVELVKIIFPDIKGISIPPTSQSNIVKILLWYVDPKTEREDLALPLQESGSGIGQVLALLYVAINSDFPQSIIIDEPQSFLHPMAIRKLFDILNHDFLQHQYIITTHSPLVISAARPNRIISLRKEETETKAKIIDATQTDELRTLLTNVGARLSDVFGAENILWVEGATEENCFPLIVSKILKRPLLGTSILGIVNVGDLEGKHKPTVLRIYKKLSEGHALIPPAVGFILDKEGRTESEQQDIERESGGKAHFITRRMYENYLLHADAITWLISQLENFSEHVIEQKDVENWIEENRWDKCYFLNLSSLPDNTLDTWLRHVHGAKFLDDLFKKLSDGRYIYDKVRYGLDLTSWLINNRPQELQDIVDLLGQILDSE